MDCFHIFVRDQPKNFSFKHLHCKFPSHHPLCFPLIAWVQVNTLRDDRPRYLVESQICQERRISPGHETVAMLNKKTLTCYVEGLTLAISPPNKRFTTSGGEPRIPNQHVTSFVCMYKHLEMKRKMSISLAPGSSTNLKL